MVQYAPKPFDASTLVHIVTSAEDPLWFRAGQLHSPPDAPAGTQPRLIVRQTLAVGDPPYTIGDMCSAPANLTVNFFNPGNIYDAVLGNLEPSSTYWYRVGYENALSKTYKFVSR